MGKAAAVSCFLLLAVSCQKNQAARVPEIHVVCGVSSFTAVKDGFLSRMREMGWEDGKNAKYFVHETESGTAAELDVLNEAVAAGADLLFVFPTGTALQAKRAAAGKVPVLFGAAMIEGTGLVESSRTPGGNVTGLRVPSAEVVRKRLEYLLALAPDAERVYAAYDPEYPANKTIVPELRRWAEASDVELVEARVRTLGELEADLARRTEPIHGIVITADTLTQSAQGWALVADYAERRGIPVSGASVSQAETGAVMGLAMDYRETGRLAAAMADTILKGRDAGSLPVATAALSLTVNLERAGILGLSVPNELLNLASRIIR